MKEALIERGVSKEVLEEVYIGMQGLENVIMRKRTLKDHVILQVQA